MSRTLLLFLWLIHVKPEQAASYMLIVDVVISFVLLTLSFLAYKKIREKSQDKIEKAPLVGTMLTKCAVG